MEAGLSSLRGRLAVSRVAMARHTGSAHAATLSQCTAGPTAREHGWRCETASSDTAQVSQVAIILLIYVMAGMTLESSLNYCS